MDDVLELIKKGQVRNLMDHINTIDLTGNIKFTYEEEEDKQIPFLDTLLVRQEDGSVKLLVYRKKSHTNQYLNFSYHHPLNHKLAVISQHSSGWKFMLAPACHAPQNLGFVRIKLQPI